MTNGLCYVQANRGFVLTRGSCTDRSWGPNCAQECHGSNDNADNGINIVPIDMSVPNATQYCCGGLVDNNGSFTCADGSPSFTIPPGRAIVGRAGLSNATYISDIPSLRNSSSTNSSSRLSPSTRPDVGTTSASCPSPNSKETTVGAAVGATLGALLLAAIGWALYERRLRNNCINAYATNMSIQPITESVIKKHQQLGPAELEHGPAELQASVHNNTSEMAVESSHSSQSYYSRTAAS
ncbi:hypothetical protein N7510_000678 [Penicillium lagena]|uniref:uncharacterized protein n=1 Tax=Penicillium lagena TaxID=94218 RepID=UPI00254012EA|nr:uncharacterized protein N7510_000678 [Penicillium lagena]KAJ5624369.1 hypothetical protein N7510_000678 [Penicillium lagena]